MTETFLFSFVCMSICASLSVCLHSVPSDYHFSRLDETGVELHSLLPIRSI